MPSLRPSKENMLPLQEIRNFLSESVTFKYGDSVGEHADNIINLHLDPKNFTMHKSVDANAMLDGVLRGDSAEVLRNHINFENVSDIRGICRVMARTHLNRTGTLQITSRGDTLAPVVLNIFNNNFNPKEYCNWQSLIEDWLHEAERGIADLNPLFTTEDITSFARMLEIGPISSRKNDELAIASAWRVVGPGIHSGFNYLNDRFQLDQEIVHNLVQTASVSGPNEIKSLIIGSSKIYQYGLALAGSFFADLGINGSQSFIKVDRHLKHAIKAFYGDAFIGNDLERFEFAFDRVTESSDCQYTPRAVDKLLYLCGSSNFYLLGDLPKKSGFNERNRKREFLEILNKLGTNAGYTFKNESDEAATQTTHRSPAVSDTFKLKITEYKNKITNIYLRAGFESEISEHLKRGVSKDTILKALDKRLPETYQSSRGIFW